MRSSSNLDGSTGEKIKMKIPSSQAPAQINPSSIQNKQKRQEVYDRQRSQKAAIERKAKLRRRKLEEEQPELKEARLAKNIPKTLENTREHDDTIVDLNDEEVLQDENMDEFANYFTAGVTPKIVVTTCRRATPASYEVAEEFVSIFPNAELVKRESNYDIKHIVEFSKNRNYTDIIIINEDHKKPNAITIIHLPDGPTAHYKLSNFIKGADVYNHGKCTAHEPELILNNFNTRLGHTVGRMFAALFPHVPEFTGRQACTFHNQRDFIFFRRHRYIFKDSERVNLQELGPRFTLKLQWLQRGTFDTKSGDFEWIRKPELETSRRRFFL